MANNISQVSFSNPDYSSEQFEIQRRQRMSDLLQQQAAEPINPTQSAGGWVIPISPWQGLNKMGQHLASNIHAGRAKEEQTALAQKMQSDAMQWYSGMPQPRPAQTIQEAPLDPMAAGTGTQQGPAVNAPAYTPTKQDQMAWLMRGGQNPMTAPMASAMLAQTMKGPLDMLGKIDPKDYTPESFRLFMAAGDPSLLKAREKIVGTNLGGTTQFRGEYSTTPVSEVAHTQTPDSVANLNFRKFEFNNLSAAQRAHISQEAQKIGISAQQLAEGRVQLLQDDSGNVHIINKISGVGTKATDASGSPLNVPKPLTESQGKANIFGSRADEADKILRGLEGKISTTGLAVKRGVENLPLIGGPAGAAGNVMLSADQQKVEQAQRNFVNAVLRVESGAAIAESEFKNAIKQYFPQPGDTAQVIEQKRQNRATEIAGLKVMAGRGTPQSSVITNPAAAVKAVNWADLK